MTTDNTVRFTKAADGGVILAQGNERIELTRSQVAQAAELLRQDETALLTFREHPLLITVGERHARDIILHLGVDGNVNMTQFGDRTCNTVLDTVTGMREWCANECPFSSPNS